MENEMKKNWRPAFAWAFIVWFISLGFTIIGLLWFNKVTMSDASGVIMFMLAAGGGITGTYTYKRSTEKLHGVTNN